MFTQTQIDNRRRWCSALRSGKFEQATGKLYVDGAYCCLGVAEVVVGVQRHNFDSLNEDDAQDKLGLSSDDLNTLMEMNDTKGKTFREIAEYIENETDARS